MFHTRIHIHSKWSTVRWSWTMTVFLGLIAAPDVTTLHSGNVKHIKLRASQRENILVHSWPVFFCLFFFYWLSNMTFFCDCNISLLLIRLAINLLRPVQAIKPTACLSSLRCPRNWFTGLEMIENKHRMRNAPYNFCIRSIKYKKWKKCG